MAQSDAAAAQPAGAASVPSDGSLEPDAFELLRDKVQAMVAYTGTSLGANLLGALIVVYLFAPGGAPPVLWVGWSGLFFALWLARAVHALRYLRRPPVTALQYRRWLAWWRAGILLSAGLWGAAAWLFYGHAQGLQQIALLLLIYSFCVACVPVLAPQFWLFVTYVVLLFVPAIVRVAIDARPYSGELAAIMLIIWLVTVALGRNSRQSFDRLSRLQHRTEHLMERLQVEKATADDARREAEVANRAKTQFFAAASHDLRQPLHALGLFAEALRQRSHDREAIELVNSINGSVDALEGLFSQLLDITRIDTGGVDVRPQHFLLGDVLRKLRLHFEPVAFEKGLALRLRGGQHAVHADPLQVERILRNLVSNAIRYTDDGGVLVGARRRGGRLLLQVWDTGTGIRESEQQRVFEEFYQVGRGAAPSPDQKKGLGLGLAIVKRLAGLMDAPLTLASVPGRGSVFTLDLPAGEASPAAPAPVPAKPLPALTLDGRRVVVVEDEPAVRHGLDVLLKSWGADVASFETVAAAVAWASACSPALPPPDLLIVDYRLEDGATGVEALVALRTRFGRAIPAIVVTGSTMTNHDTEAERHDFHLMIKPVVPNKLRAMIGFKLGVR